MCGIAGVVDARAGGARHTGAVEAMLDAIGHRGPDDRGIVTYDAVALGACRLVVVEPSAAGAQPMTSADGRHHLIFNGELYDHDRRRAALVRSGSRFRSHSDTEVVLDLLARHGEAILPELEGMFAFAWWNADTRRLVLARDRFGEKPLFYATHDDVLWFASEEKALFAAGVPCAFDPETWTELLLFHHLAGGRSPFAGVRRLLPGHVLEVAADGTVATRRWWNPPTGAPRVPAGPRQLRAALEASVRLRMDADVPVGVMLSGGLDSSAVAVLAASATGEPVHAYTVRYPDDSMDEGEHARLVADTVGLRHHEIVVPDHEAPALLEAATHLRGEPLSHAATPYLVALARVARRDVKVLLSGEGADELFGGYGRYQPFRLGALLDPLASASRVLPAGPVVSELRRLAAIPRDDRVVFTGGHTVAGLDVDVADALAARRLLADEASAVCGRGVRQSLWYDQHTHLPAVLDHADRSTMGAGIECRLPFLAPAVAQIATDASTVSLLGRRGKWLLRRAMAGAVPDPIRHRRKQGWSAPWGRLLREREPLRELVRSLPTDPIIATAPLPPSTVEQAVQRFLAREPGSAGLVWMLARIALWHEVCVNQRRVLT